MVIRTEKVKLCDVYPDELNHVGIDPGFDDDIKSYSRHHE